MAKQDDKNPRAPIVGDWMGNPNYVCPICGFATLDETVIAEHLDPRWGLHRVRIDPADGQPVATVEALTPDERTELDVLRAEKAAREAAEQAAATDAGKQAQAGKKE